MTFNLKDFKVFGLTKVIKICLVKVIKESATKDTDFKREWQLKVVQKSLTAEEVRVEKA